MALNEITLPLASRAKLFRGLSDPSRLAILDAVVDEARSVTEVCEITGLAQSNVSNHLACLLGCGLVVREQRGRFAYYRLADRRIATLLDLGDEILREVARGVDICIVQEIRPPGPGPCGP
jgi:DNA-binding transcriptional ArsR family regulator